MNKEPNPLLKFYEEHGISPVRQDISDLPGHVTRRARLYQKLGMPPALFKDKCVMEIGPGGGYNSLVFFEWGARHVDFVEPNLAGRVELCALLQRHKVAEDRWYVLPKAIENTFGTDTYPIVIAEGFIPGLNEREAVLKAIARRVAPGGVLVVTCIDEVSTFMEVVKRLVAWRLLHAKGIKALVDRVAVLSEAFREQVVMVGGTRPVEDWVTDVLLNPSIYGRSFSMMDAIAEFSGLGFKHLGASPNLFTDLSWYKHTDYDKVTELLIQFQRRRHLLLDYQSKFSERGGWLANMKLVELCNSVRGLAEAAEDPIKMVNIKKVIHTLSLISQHVPSVKLAMDEAAKLLVCDDLSPGKIAASKEFLKAMGRGMQYVSMVKEEKNEA